MTDDMKQVLAHGDLQGRSSSSEKKISGMEPQKFKHMATLAQNGGLSRDPFQFAILHG